MIRSTVVSLAQRRELADEAEIAWEIAKRAQAREDHDMAEDFAREALDRYIALGWTGMVEMIRIRMGWE
jgi:hypothetical protein